MRIRNRVLRFFAFLIFGSAFIAGVGYLVMLLWNALIPEIFTVPEITFLQALGLLVLARILFGGFGGRRFGRQHSWKNKWMQMTPEEKAEFKKKWRSYAERKKEDE